MSLSSAPPPEVSSPPRRQTHPALLFASQKTPPPPVRAAAASVAQSPPGSGCSLHSPSLPPLGPFRICARTKLRAACGEPAHAGSLLTPGTRAGNSWAPIFVPRQTGPWLRLGCSRSAGDARGWLCIAPVAAAILSTVAAAATAVHGPRAAAFPAACCRIALSRPLTTPFSSERSRPHSCAAPDSSSELPACLPACP